MPNPSYYTLLNNILIPASGYVYSIPIPTVSLEGECTLLVTSNYASTSGTLSIVYELSHDGVNWAQVESLSTLLTGFTKTSGPAADGKTLLYFSAPLSTYIRFKFTETGTSNPVQIISTLGIL